MGLKPVEVGTNQNLLYGELQSWMHTSGLVQRLDLIDMRTAAHVPHAASLTLGCLL